MKHTTATESLAILGNHHFLVLDCANDFDVGVIVARSDQSQIRERTSWYVA